MSLAELPQVAETRPILNTTGDGPVLTAVQLQLARWVSDYYVSPLFEAAAPMLPPGQRLRQRARLSIGAAMAEGQSRLSPLQARIVDYVRRNGSVDIERLVRSMGEGARASASRLVDKGCDYMKGVILAAGYGRRFALGEGRLHKLLLRIGNRAVIDYTLEAFGKVGIRDVAMVVGYRAELLRDYNGDGARHGIHLEYLFNPQYERGNALSLNIAKSFTQEEPFLLSMGDHLVSPELLSRMLAPATDSSALAVDFSPDIHDIEEATRVRVDSEGWINRIGKDLHEWDGVDAGVFRLTPAIYEAITAVTCEERDEHQISEAVTWMISQGYCLNACDISGCFWQDVDTWEDLRHATAALAETTL